MSVSDIQSDFDYCMYDALGDLVGWPDARGYRPDEYEHNRIAAGLALFKIKYGLVPKANPYMSEEEFMYIVITTTGCVNELKAVLHVLQGGTHDPST